MLLLAHLLVLLSALISDAIENRQKIEIYRIRKNFDWQHLAI